MQESFLTLDEIDVERKFDIQEKEATLIGSFTMLMKSGGLSISDCAT